MIRILVSFALKSVSNTEFKVLIRGLNERAHAIGLVQNLAHRKQSITNLHNYHKISKINLMLAFMSKDITDILFYLSDRVIFPNSAKKLQAKFLTLLNFILSFSKPRF